jgi:hypothetical protein
LSGDNFRLRLLGLKEKYPDDARLKDQDESLGRLRLSGPPAECCPAVSTGIIPEIRLCFV